uniref:ABC1 atypical kinase-like domain-containing protein n=1 Tax=Alexandrium monilatum TaxID=311494 RepID=A0A7S4RD62_9DINO
MKPQRSAASAVPGRSRRLCGFVALTAAACGLAAWSRSLSALSWLLASAPCPSLAGSPHRTQRCNVARSASAASAVDSTPAAACPLTGRAPEDLVTDVQRLLRDVSDVALSTGFETGFTRAAQGAQAAAFTAAELVREPPQELNEAFAARLLRRLFERLGATYVKLGQFIASSPTVFPADYVREFQQCLDSTNTVPFSEIRKIIEDDLGMPTSKVFSYLDPVPMASASIAQVHAATLVTGEDVVVKVQKPGIEEVLQTDLGFVYLASRVLEFINPELNSRGSLADIASDLRTSMLGELDFRQEQANLETFRTFLEENDLAGVAVAPRPFAQASSRRVLTMERLRGVPLVDLEGIRRYSADPEATLVAALNVWALSVQRCEFFHADVHAGNLLVLEDGRVGFLDFGIVGRLPPAMSTAIDNLNIALAENDAKGMARALISMGATVGDVDEEAFARDIEKLLERLGGATAGAAGAAVDESQIQDIVLDIAQVAGNNGLKLPREFGLLIKQSLYFDRYTKLLAPDLDMMSDSRIASLGGQAGTKDAEDVPAEVAGA